MKPTNEDKNKGWYLVFIQFLFGGIIFISAYFEHRLTGYTIIPSLELIGLTLLILSVIVFLSAVISFKQFITPNPIPREDAKLITDGIYAYIRHPMYLFGILLTFGYSLYENAYFTLILCFLYVFFFVYKIKFEEKHLQLKFPEYDLYRMTTKKLFPFIY